MVVTQFGPVGPQLIWFGPVDLQLIWFGPVGPQLIWYCGPVGPRQS
jgi:hypothetical protein